MGLAGVFDDGDNSNATGSIGVAPKLVESALMDANALGDTSPAVGDATALVRGLIILFCAAAVGADSLVAAAAGVTFVEDILGPNQDARVLILLPSAVIDDGAEVFGDKGEENAVNCGGDLIDPAAAKTMGPRGSIVF